MSEPSVTPPRSTARGAVLSPHLVAVLPLTQAPIGQRCSAAVADGDEAAGEGDVAAAALRQQLLVL